MEDIFNRLPPARKFDFSEFGETEVQPLGRIQSITAGFLHRNALSIPHVTHNDEVDVSDLELRRKTWNKENEGQKISPLPLLVKAVTASLKTYPRFNSSLDETGKNLIFKKYFNIGIAVDTPNGLLVPVIRDCDQKSIFEIGDEITALAEKARSKGLSMPEMSGGCISISSLGHIGGTSFSPIINSPEVAILGVTKIQPRPMPAKDGSIDWASMMPMSLSYDHRAINGADAARFVVEIGKNLSASEF